MKEPSYAIVLEQGPRAHMEDQATICTLITRCAVVTFGGVYDGHSSLDAGCGGRNLACLAATEMPRIMRKHLSRLGPLKAFTRSYLDISEMMRDAQYSGTCAANFLIRRGIIYHANVGDCAIFIVGNSVKELTRVHRVNSPDERQRVFECGAYIEKEYFYRGEHGLMVTRSLGDVFHKAVGSSALPSIGRYAIAPGDKYLLACSDGLTDVVIGREILKCSQEASDSQGFASKLKEFVTASGGEDNLAILVLKL